MHCVRSRTTTAIHCPEPDMQHACITVQQLPDSMLHVAERPAHAACAGLMRGNNGYCYGYEEWSSAPVARIESASANVVLILEIGAPLLVANRGGRHSAGPTRHQGGFVAGLHDGPTHTTHAGHQAGIQINLPPLAAGQVFGMPLSEIAHQVVAAADLLPHAHRARLLALAELPTWDARLDAVDAMLLGATQRLSAQRTVPRGFRELAWAIARIEQCAGQLRIDALARELGWSERRLQRAFATQVGVSAKLFARLVRFNALMDRARSRPDESWAGAAYALGFADQSHLVRDVRQFTGMTPSAAEGRLRAIANTG